MRATTLLIHLGGPNVTIRLSLLKQLQHCLWAGDDVFTQATNIHPSFLGFMHWQLCILRCQQVVDFLVVKLRGIQ
jgi:hypothetical protein